ncbi:hypothetical protein [Alkalicoccobacillus gibsonii]|uniref:hypothetical protein n=1 Tax=Alkalicoccobacillus gibsonii TaxID=79881 RepID=UPI0019340563|nr:hypothetical protein [Alkalicoccobacillus gibsonii]MBM0067969.1 hypothetical protein [Alkalicoccobacillus gibsonii]
MGKNAHKVDTETTQDMAEKAKKKLFQAFEAKGVHISESFNASIRGEMKQTVERVKIPDSLSPLGYILERQHRLEVSKFSDINQMRQVFILAYHLGIYHVEQDIERLTEGWKGEWESWKIRRNRYKKAWSYALNWMQDAGFIDDSTTIPKELELELDAAKVDTKPLSPMRNIVNDMAKKQFLGL